MRKIATVALLVAGSVLLSAFSSAGASSKYLAQIDSNKRLKLTKQ